jgi:hypothetical protein
MLAAALMPTALAFIGFDRLVLRLNRNRDAIELHHGRHIADRFTVGLLQERFDLIDTLIERAQAHTAVQDGTPPLAEIAQTLTESTAKEHILIHIQPKALKLLQDREVRNHIVLTVLAFQHGHLQIIEMTPACFQAPTVMPITRKLVGIRASALPTVPINLACLRTHPSWFSFLPAQFRRHLFFEKGGEHWLDRHQGGSFRLLLYFLQHVFALCSL